jgi:asparagine synthase (glutamine-hydrolysing)
MNTNKITKTLDQFLIKSFATIPKKKIGILFSGGIDSSTIAKYSLDLGFNPSLFTFGTAFSKDYFYAKKLAKDLKLPFRYLELTQKKIIDSIPNITSLLAKIGVEPNIMQISLGMGFYHIAQLAKKEKIDLFLSGQGSDELFGGYNKYLQLSSNDLALQMKQDIKNLFKIDVVRDAAMTKEFGIDIVFPYLDADFVKYTQNIPLGLKIHKEERKIILRELAKQKKLPEYIFRRPKNALQYSSGIQKIVEKYLKKRSLANSFFHSLLSFFV